MEYEVTIFNKDFDLIQGRFYSLFFDEEKEMLVLVQHLDEDEWTHPIKRYAIDFKDIESIKIEPIYEDNEQKVSCS